MQIPQGRQGSQGVWGLLLIVKLTTYFRSNVNSWLSLFYILKSLHRINVTLERLYSVYGTFSFVLIL